MSPFCSLLFHTLTLCFDMSLNLLIFSFMIFCMVRKSFLLKKNQNLFKMESSAQLQGKGLRLARSL